jgi:hypothetical protein
MVSNFLNRFLNLSLALCAVSLCFACKNKTNTSPDLVKVSPFDTTHFETQALSEEDRAKLAAASGKTVKPIEIDALADRINNSTGKLHVYCFWNLQSAGSLSTLKALNVLSEKYDSSQLKVVFINMPSSQKVDDVNLYIRENQLTEETLILEKADVSFFSKKIRKDFTGVTALPVVLMVNKAEQTLMFYNKTMDEKELMAMVQPLIQ